VEGGNVLHHVKREGELSGRGKCPVGVCPEEMFGSPAGVVCDVETVLLREVRAFLVARGILATSLYTVNPFYRAMLCISAVYAVTRCLSVCLSVRHVRELRQNE